MGIRGLGAKTSSLGNHAFRVMTVVLCFAAATGCINNGAQSTSTKSGTSTGTNPLANITTSLTDSAIVLSSVLKNTQNPTSTFDLLGDGTSAFGLNCTTANGGNGNVGPSTCNCAYTYTRTNGTIQSVESVEVPTTYHEDNLLRCLYVGLPAAITTVKVRVHALTANIYSNELTFRFSSGSSILDTANPGTFAKAIRYQCKDVIRVPNIMDSRVYDPFQSEDPRNSYPSNFYTSNMGAAMAIFAGGIDGFRPPLDWICPSIPNDPVEGMNGKIYSIDFDAPVTIGSKVYLGNSKVIYPNKDSNHFDRTLFHLAKGATGIFNVPVNSLVVPTLVTISPDSQGNQSGVAPLGFGAAPIPSGVSGTESCPDPSITIPPGYQWVKVWLFRAALPTRKYVDSQPMRNMGRIDCAPGEWTQTGSRPTTDGTDTHVNFLASIFPDCYNKAPLNPPTTRGNLSIYLTELNTGAIPKTALASRFVEGVLGADIQKCVNIEPNSVAITAPLGAPTMGNTAFGVVGPGRAPANSLFATATDQWQLNSTTYTTSGLYCTGPGNVCVDYQSACVGGPRLDPTGICEPASQGIAKDLTPTQRTIDSDTTANRYDYLFIVTPSSVNSRDMTNPSSDAYRQYTPYRYVVSSDCNADNPDLDGTCVANASKAIRNYGIKLHDVGLAGDPPADDPNRPGTFPVCALQPIN